jgi:hypothetical protein
MGTRILVLGIFTLGLVLGLLFVTWVHGSYAQHFPSAYPAYVAAAVYWLYSAYRIISGKDVEARKIEDYLNRERK